MSSKIIVIAVGQQHCNYNMCSVATDQYVFQVVKMFCFLWSGNWTHLGIVRLSISRHARRNHPLHQFEQIHNAKKQELNYDPCALRGITMLPLLCYVYPPAFDQRTVGLQTHAFNQKSCGSCWAAVVASAADTMLLRQSAVLNLSENTDTLRVSTQWIMQNSPSNYGCGGGNFVPAIRDLQ